MSGRSVRALSFLQPMEIVPKKGPCVDPRFDPRGGCLRVLDPLFAGPACPPRERRLRAHKQVKNPGRIVDASQRPFCPQLAAAFEAHARAYDVDLIDYH